MRLKYLKIIRTNPEANKYGGFKATPASGWTFAHTIAQDRVHELNSGYSLNRFNTGHLLDEKGLGTKTWIS